MRYTSLRRMDFAAHSITVDTVLSTIHQEGKESYRELLEEMLEDHGALIRPAACWREIRVTHADENSVDLCSRRIADPYLAGRLREIRTIKVFQAGVADMTWQIAGQFTDPLEKYLYNHVLSACFDTAFRQVCIDMTRSMPKGAKLFMDNPGISGGWGMEHQEALMDILFDGEREAALDSSNPFAFSGIVYTSNRADSTRTNIRYMQADELIRILYQTAGILPPEDL